MLERRSSAPHGSARLPAGRQGIAERRRTRRRRALIALSLLIFLLSAGIIYELWQNGTRISHIQIFGADKSFADIAHAAIQGTYFGIIPRDSIFFFPASRIRADIIAAHSDIAAVSIFRNGLTSISIKTNDRAPIARWCGLSPSGPGVDEYCYVFDASGLIYATAAATTTTINNFRVYAPLESETLEPLLATILHANKLPAALDFARQLDTFGSPVMKVVLRDDEVDDYLTSGTRITYVLGNEQNAFTALVSARDNLNLADGSLEYVDLRFNGKVYLKKK